MTYLIPYPKDGKVLLAADWHGNTGQALYAINEAVRRNINTIIQLGDFGFWGEDKFLRKTQKAAEAAGIHIYWIDGNHEQHIKLLEILLDPDTGLRPITPNITHLPRNFRWEWDGISFLALGGAQSIDKFFRTEGFDYFPEERITPEEAQTAIDGGHADIMFTHDAPSTLPNPVTNDPYGQIQAARAFGSDVLEDCKSHQDLLAQVTNSVRPHYLFHGHYHLSQMRSYYHLPIITGDFDFGISLDQGTREGNPKNLYTLDLSEIKETIDALSESRG